MSNTKDSNTGMHAFIGHPWFRAGIWLVVVVLFVRFIDRWPTVDTWSGIVAQVSPWPLLCLGALFVLATVLRTVRWVVLLRNHLSVDFFRALAVFGWTFLMMALTPLRAAELLRPAWVKKQGGSFFAGVGVLAVERLADMTVLAGMLVAIMLVKIDVADSWGVVLGTVEAFILIGAYFTVLAAAGPLGKRLRASHRAEGPVLRRAALFLEGLEAGARPATNLKVLVLTGAVWGVLAIGYEIVLSSLFPELHWSAALLVLCAVNLSGIVWLSPGNIGVYEAVAVFALGAYNVPSDEALIAAIGLHGVVLVAIAVIGLISKGMLMKQGDEWSELI